MNARQRRPLKLTTETLRRLSPSGLRVVHGGTTVLVRETDPATLTPTDLDTDGRGVIATTPVYTCMR